MSSPEHHSADRSSVACGTITVSDTRSESDDKSGDAIRDALTMGGHSVVRREIIPDDPAKVRTMVVEMRDSGDVHAIIVTGGTGIAARDTTIEAIAPLLQKELPGFGELFRILSYEQVGAAAILSRATAGISGRCAVFLLPGSIKAVQLAMEKLIVPPLGHIAALLRPD